MAAEFIGDIGTEQCPGTIPEQPSPDWSGARQTAARFREHDAFERRKPGAAAVSRCTATRPAPRSGLDRLKAPAPMAAAADTETDHPLPA